MAKNQIFPPPAGLHADCALCYQHFRPVEDQQKECFKYAGHLSDLQADRLIQEVLQQSTYNLEYVKAKLETHGDLILTRWTKKSKDKRAAILSSAAPNVFGDWPPPPQVKTSAEYAQPIEGPYTTENITQWVKPRSSVCSFAPWLELQGFMEDRMQLLSLLHVRTQYSPSAWAGFDIRGTSVAFTAGLIPVLFNAKCVRMFSDRYGEMTEWSGALTHSWAYAGFPRAYLTLEAQSVIMGTLHALVDSIVADAEPGGNAKWVALVQSGFRGSGCEALWGAYTNQAFAPPVLFDPEVMLRKAKARLDLVLDEFWLMQTEPAYMHHVIRHASGSIVCDEASGVNSTVRWNHIAMSLMAEAVNRLTTWRLIVTECQSTSDLFKKHETHIGPGKPLPREVNTAVVSLGTIVNLRLKRQNYIFDKLLPSMRSFRDRFTAYQGGGTLRHHERQNMDPSNKCDRLYWNIDLSHGALQSNNLNGASIIFQMLEREMLDDVPARLVEKLDKRLYDQLSDIATTDELRCMWLYSQLDVSKADDGAIDAYYRQIYGDQPARKVGNAVLDRRCEERIGRLLRLFGESSWPKGGRKDLDWLDKATASRKCSDETAPVRRKRTKAKAARDVGGDSTMSEADIQKLNLSESEEVEPEVVLSSIPVRQDSLAVFHRMYPTDATSAQGSVRWTQFVQAMADAGFVATEANGSAVNFTNGNGSIAFHKPHPEPTVEPITLHSWAKCMRRRFEWTRERFVLREKEGGET
ncbi:hypothetical protein LTR36_002477 [Oleoguttula mirabilis]|uniref:Uncharacterized protein n=1 Tax=Oleoguttula mirabilis TaxID=1507867 RepID=A0AAV9JLR5_9PEZI|nr:hypothetical protein LTR36_002477 [Oleoguttula mirabilis]